MAGFKNIDEVEAHARRLMRKEYKVEANGKVHYLSPNRIGYSFKFDNAKRRFGQCSYTDKRISLSKPLASNNLDNFFQINDTILHEIAHALSLFNLITENVTRYYPILIDVQPLGML